MNVSLHVRDTLATTSCLTQNTLGITFDDVAFTLFFSSPEAFHAFAVAVGKAAVENEAKPWPQKEG